MFDWDAVIIGSGPAGITAGLYISRAGYRAIVIEKESFGGNLKNIAHIENYPGFLDGISGPELATAMVAQAKRYGSSAVISIPLFLLVETTFTFL